MERLHFKNLLFFLLPNVHTAFKKCFSFWFCFTFVVLYDTFRARCAIFIMWIIIITHVCVCLLRSSFCFLFSLCINLFLRLYVVKKC